MTGRLLVPTTTPDVAAGLARDTFPDLPMVTVPVVGDVPVAVPGAADRLVFAVPDVLGRLLRPPDTERLVVVIDAVVGSTVDVAEGHTVLRHGEELGDPGRVRGAIARLAKEIGQRPGVQPACHPTPPYKAPFLAPGGLGTVPDWCRVIRPTVPGLPDLVVVEPISRPPDGRRIEAPRLVVR